MLAVVRADVGHLLAHLGAKNGTIPRSDYRLYVDEVSAGRVLAGLRDGVPVVLGGVFVPDAGGPCTCWFSVVPGGLSQGGLLQVVRETSGMLAACQPAAADGLAAYVRDGHASGERLARIVGFEPTEIALGDMRRWIWARR
jgi:hypothetical protein